jgi:hypothetical protein
MFSRFAIGGLIAVLLAAPGCMGLDSGTGGGNGTQSCDGKVNIPGGTTVEVIYPYPFASAPTLTIYAWHHDWQIVDNNEKSFKIKNKNGNKQRTIDWEARGLRVMQMPPKAETRVVGS